MSEPTLCRDCDHRKFDGEMKIFDYCTAPEQRKAYTGKMGNDYESPNIVRRYYVKDPICPHFKRRPPSRAPARKVSLWRRFRVWFGYHFLGER